MSILLTSFLSGITFVGISALLIMRRRIPLILMSFSIIVSLFDFDGLSLTASIVSLIILRYYFLETDAGRRKKITGIITGLAIAAISLILIELIFGNYGYGKL